MVKRSRKMSTRPRATTRRVRRRMNISVPRNIGSRVPIPKVTFKRTSNIGAWTFSTVTVPGYWQYLTYNMSQHFTNFTEIASLFDEYKVNAIKVTFRPRYDNIPIAGQSQAFAHVIIDPSSSVTPTGAYSQASLNSFLENGNVKTYTLNKPFSVYWKPKTSVTTPTSTYYTASRYLKTTDNTAAFRGFHMFLQQNNMATDNTNIVLDQFVTVYLTARYLK